MAGLRLDIVAVGRLKEDYWVRACAEYRKRLSRYATLSISEVAAQSASSEADCGRVLREEAVRLRQRLAAGACTVVLDRAGRQFTSEEMAAHIVELQNHGVSRLAFVIGGSWGIDETLKAEADLLLSFGTMTLPHNLARVVLLEQLYRWFRIINGEPYHK
jgi:23S rRNA (pseudouridine1915-N3)-methyltransferase